MTTSLNDDGAKSSSTAPLPLPKEDNSHEGGPNPSTQSNPISGPVPFFTGGVDTTYQTEVNLRHRHNTPRLNRYSTTPPHYYYDNHQLKLTSMSLDDADIAAGATAVNCYSEPSATTRRNRASSQPIVSSEHPATPRGRTFEHDGAAVELPLRPSSDNVRHRKRLWKLDNVQSSLGLHDKTSLRYNNGKRHDSNSYDYLMPTPPSLQTMDRGEMMMHHHSLQGSESDFLSLSYRGSNKNNIDTAQVMSSSSNESYSLLSTQQDRIMNRSSSHPPFGLSTIDASPSPIRRSVDTEATELPMPPMMDATNNNNNNTILPMGSLSTKFKIFGWDMTHYTRRSQFLLSAGGTFGFSLLYGYLQELISVELCHRKLGLFLASTQFLVYATLSYFIRNLDRSTDYGGSGKRVIFSSYQGDKAWSSSVPMEVYVGLSILRAIDLGMTNMAMQYVNYPAKTLMKSTRIVFTMLFGVLVTKKRYGIGDYGIVGLMVAGLGIFMHADAKTSAVFQPLGVLMLTVSLLCDGAISNVSESIMNRYEVGQDEFIFRLYSVALFFVTIAAAMKGDLRDGLSYLTQPGTLKEIEEGLDPTWCISSKFLTLLLFSTTGYLSSSCSAAITKSFGALTMSITSTARKAATIFLSFALFPNECTWEHISGIILFIGSLIGKSMRASRHNSKHPHYKKEGHGVDSRRRKDVEDVV